MIKLTPEQNKHYDSIKWLFDGPRGVGKTTVLMDVLVNMALNGREVYLDDFSHMPFLGHNIMGRQRFIDTIYQYIQKNYKNHGLQINMTRCTLKMRK